MNANEKFLASSAQVDEAAARCAELFGLKAPSPDC